MFVAINNDNKRVYIDKVISNDYKNQKFFCPSCGGELIVKNGSINIPHFDFNTYLRKEVTQRLFFMLKIIL